MNTLLFGHRGSGKTTLLERLRGRYKVFDLDEEIGARTGQTPAQWLAVNEATFRAKEKEVLAQLLDGEAIIALGAGFEGPVPSACRKVWVRRVTDAGGRSFLNRPRLEKNLAPLQEYAERFPVRDERFAAWAGEELFLPEGEIDGMEFFFDKKIEIPGALTALQENFRDWPQFHLRRECRVWELRDDLLTPAQLELALGTLPARKILFSIRKRSFLPPRDARIDWALELGLPDFVPYSLSLHERSGSVADACARLQEAKSLIKKLAIEIGTFKELLEGHRWWLEDPEHRSFLPRSTNGRWRFYRSLFGPRMPLHFLREGAGSAVDQPYLWQAVLQKPMGENFAAVLGDPVDHSRSPREHRDQPLPFVSVQVRENEWHEAVPVLRELGMKFAAVTSPLKKLAFALADEKSSEALKTGAANTLIFDAKIRAQNTDLLALEKWYEQDLKSYASVWIWGGGGLKETLKEVWPKAERISARAGLASTPPPELVVWAVGRGREFKFPAATVRPQLVADLNYGDDSPGLEWAVAAGLRYQSGLKMFKLQAELQRKFWKAP